MKRFALLLALVSSVVFGDVLLQNQGATQGPVSTVNCSGAGVTCSRTGSTGTVAISATSTAGTGSCGANNFVTAVNASGAAPTCAQVCFANLCGTATDGQLVGPYSGTGACGANTWASTLTRNASPTCTQPGFSNLSGTATDSQLASAYSGVAACAAHKWTSTLTRNASPTCTQPDFSDLTGTATDTQLANAYSGTGACAAGKAATTLSRNASPTCSDVSGIGACAAGKSVSTLNGLAAPTCSDTSGIGACAAGKAVTTLNGLAAPTCTTVSGTGACAAGQAVTTINALAAPTCTGVSGTGACSSTTLVSAINGLAAPTCTSVEPRHLDPQTVGMPLPPNGSFEGQLATDQVPDLWNMVTGAWATDARNAVSDSYDGAIAVEFLNTATATKIRSSFFPVTAGTRYELEAFIKKVATPTQTADVAIEWYDRGQALLSTDTIGTVLTGIGAGWTSVSEYKLAPSTAAYAKVFAAKHDSGTFGFKVDAVRVSVQDRVLARYTRTSSQTLTTGTTTVFDYSSSVYDTHSAVTTGATWKFTVPAGKAGYYRVEAAVSFNTGGTDKTLMEVGLRKNGTRVLNFYSAEPNRVANSTLCSGSSTILLADADYIDVTAYQNSGGNLNTAASGDYNWVSITRVDPE